MPPALLKLSPAMLFHEGTELFGNAALVMADKQLLKARNVGFGNHEQPTPMHDEVMVGEDDGRALVGELFSYFL